MRSDKRRPGRKEGHEGRAKPESPRTLTRRQQ